VPRRRSRRTIGLSLLAPLLVPGALAAQTPPPDRPPRFTTEASAVVLDVVVRDGRGRPVLGLRRDDFQVFEGRSRQTISVFEGPAVAAPDPGIAAAGAGQASAAALAPPAPRVVALVFEQLGPAARILAARAAHRLVDSLDRGDFAAVFAVDRAVHTLAAYAPAAAVTAAIDTAAKRPGLPLRRAGVVPGAEFGDAERGAPTPETRDEAKRTRGMATLDALAQIVKGLALLPGRKMIVLFSEGLSLDAAENEAQLVHGHDVDDWLQDGRFERFQRLVEDANAAQVAFYTFDAAGLRVESQFAIGGFGRAPYVGLLALAEGTGGAFVENTNELAPGALRALEDLGSYYVLGFTSAKPPDGEYRELKVRVSCAGCTVLSRRGYRASPPGPPRQLGPRDVAPFLVLEGGRDPRDLPVVLDATPASAGPPRAVAIAVTLPESAVTSGGLVTILARLRDARGRAVAVLSQHFELRGARAPGAALRFERTVPVPDGRGVLELVAYDHATGRATVLRRDYDPSQ
jgi:VWFA-related protein